MANDQHTDKKGCMRCDATGETSCVVKADTLGCHLSGKCEQAAQSHVALHEHDREVIRLAATVLERLKDQDAGNVASDLWAIYYSGSSVVPEVPKAAVPSVGEQQIADIAYRQWRKLCKQNFANVAGEIENAIKEAMGLPYTPWVYPGNDHGFPHGDTRLDYLQPKASVSAETRKPQAAWVGGVCKTCGAYTHSCKCEHPDRGVLAQLFAAPPVGAGSTAGPATRNGEPEVAASSSSREPTIAQEIEQALWSLHSYESNRDDAGRVYSEADITKMVTAVRAFSSSVVARADADERAADYANSPEVVEAAKEWVQRFQVLPVLPPSAEEAFRMGAAWAFSSAIRRTCSCGANPGQYHATGCGHEGVFNG